jgi:hypothetical protein
MPSTIVKQIVLNGSLFYPTGIEREIEKVGDELIAADGTLRFYYRKTRTILTLSWTNVDEFTVALIRNIANLTTSFSMTDDLGATYTVINTGLKAEWDAKGIMPNGEVIFKNVELEVKQV